MRCKNQFIFKRDLKKIVKGIKRLMKMNDEIQIGEKQLEEELVKAVYSRCIDLTNDIALYYYQINRMNDDIWKEIYTARDYFKEQTIDSCNNGIIHLCDSFKL